MPVARLPLTQKVESRIASTAKDSRGVNCFFESRGQQESGWIVKRPGQVQVPITPAIGASVAQGMYVFNGYLYVVTSNTVYRIDTSWNKTTVGTITGTVQNVYWAESANHSYLFFHNGSNGYVITGAGTFSQVLGTSVYKVTILTGGSGYVSPTVVFDPPISGVTATGTVTSVGGVITGVVMTDYGSGYTIAPAVTFSGAPGTNATGSTTLNGFPTGTDTIADGAVYLDGYTVVATKVGQIYNSDLNTPTLWDPLNFTTAEADPDPIRGIVKHFNYICVFGEWGTEFFFDAANAVGSPFNRQESYKMEIGSPHGGCIAQFQQAVMFVGNSKIKGKSVFMLDGVTPTTVSTRYIEKYLNADTNNMAQAFVFRIEGHTFYVLTLDSLDLTFVYDVDEKEWYQWTTSVGGSEHEYSVWCATEFNGVTCGLDDVDGNIYNLSVNVYDDDGDLIYFRVVTNNLDSGSMKRKFYKSGQIVGDKVAATMSISHSDDDFATWSTARTVDLSKARCILYQCGWSRRRAWQFLVTDSVPIRLSAFEVVIEGGEQENDPQIEQ